MEEIKCQRGCVEHVSRELKIELGGPTGYVDLPPIPYRLARSFVMNVWDPIVQPIYPMEGPYCPARDAVSNTIFHLGVWEPVETILALHVLSSASRGQSFLDFGSQIGWFTLLAASCGVKAVSFEADEDNLRLMLKSVAMNGWSDLVMGMHIKIGKTTPDMILLPWDNIRLVKIDIEGAERDAIRMLRPALQRGLIDHLMMEVTPSFGEYYPDLVREIVEYGYEAWLLPRKMEHPEPLCETPDRPALVPVNIEEIKTWHQENVWFARPDKW